MNDLLGFIGSLIIIILAINAMFLILFSAILFVSWII